jgi:hypothetical protein
MKKVVVSVGKIQSVCEYGHCGPVPWVVFQPVYLGYFITVLMGK